MDGKLELKGDCEPSDAPAPSRFQLRRIALPSWLVFHVNPPVDVPENLLLRDVFKVAGTPIGKLVKVLPRSLAIGRNGEVNLIWRVSGRSAVRTAHRVASDTACADADVFTNWQSLAARKKPEDLLGNNINHPNDFGHWICFRLLDALGL